MNFKILYIYLEILSMHRVFTCIIDGNFTIADQAIQYPCRTIRIR